MTDPADLGSALMTGISREDVPHVRPEVVRAAIMRARELPQRRRTWRTPWRSSVATDGSPLKRAAALLAIVALTLLVVVPRPYWAGFGADPSALPSPVDTEFVLGTGRDATGVTGISTVFQPDQPIEVHLSRAAGFGFSPVEIRVFRIDTVEGLIRVWDISFPVGEEVTSVDFSIPVLMSGPYRLVAYHAMTEPTGSVDFEVVGNAVPALPTRPPIPGGWHRVVSGSGDLELVLPQDIVASETSGPIFANERPDGSSAWIELVAEGPLTAAPQPEEASSLAEWLERRWLDQRELRSPIAERVVLLPAGEAIELRARFAGGATGERSIIVYAIRTPEGVAFLSIEGAPEALAARASDLDLIAHLMEFPASGTDARERSTGAGHPTP